MKTIILFCGVGKSGKSKTLREYFKVTHIKKLGKMQRLERKNNGKKVYGVSLNSPQELKGFCKVDEVIDNIKKRIQKCGQTPDDQDYVLIIPFGVYGAVRGKLNENAL